MARRSQNSSALMATSAMDRPAYTRLPEWWLTTAEPTTLDPARLYAVHTKPRQEKALAGALESASVSCYLPLTRRLRSWEHRRREVQEPLFPGYLFLRATVDQTYLVHSSGRAVQVIPAPDAAMTLQELLQIDRALAGGAVLDPYPYLVVGKRVVVARGPLRGVEGEVDLRTTPHRVVLKVSTLGRAVAVEIDSTALEPLE